MLLSTDRIIIRKPRLDDVEDLLEINHDEVVLKYNCIQPMDNEMMMKHIEKVKEDKHHYVIEHITDKKVIGGITLEHDSLRYGVSSTMLSYDLNTKYTKQGFMSEALLAVIKYCFEVLNVDLVSARVFTPNEASNKLLLRLGFTLEGTLKHAVKAYKDIIYDDNLYCLTKKEYLTKYQ